MKLYKIKADDVILYHKTYYVEANSIKEAKQKLVEDDDYERHEDRAGTSFEKTRVLKIEKVEEEK
jgi:hypothetical protein